MKKAASLLCGSTSGLELLYPSRIVEPSAWLGHTPFALWLIEALKPRILVELGVHTGNSYCAFLEAVHELGLDTRCFGIDHWKGDEHAGFYSEEVYEQLRDYHDARYGSFSTLLRSSFNEAVIGFADGSIDLLHIDGFHTYEAVSSDFMTWLPKASSRAVVLFHDSAERGRGFGIWRFWDEIASKYPHFEFIHSHGLGVAYVGSEPLAGALCELFSIGSDAAQERARHYFARLGVSVVDRFEKQRLVTGVEQLKSQVTLMELELETVRSESIRINAEAAGVNDLYVRLQASTLQSSQLRKQAESKVKDLERLLQTSTLQLSQAAEEVKSRINGLEARLQASTLQVSDANVEAAKKIVDLETKLHAITLELSKADARAKNMELTLQVSALQIRTKTAVAHQRTALTVRLQQELFAANREKRVYEGQLHDIFKSNFWRVTGPIRSIVTWFRRLLATDRVSSYQGRDLP